MIEWSTLKKLIWLKKQSGATTVWNIVTGVSPLALTNALAKKIKRLIQYGKCSTVDGDIYCNNGKLVALDDELPSGYKRITGIKFDGDFYYNTGESLSGDDDVTMTLDNLASSGKNVFGSYNGANAKNFSLYIYGSSTSGSYFRYGDQLKRPKYGGTGKRTITFGASGTSGFAEDSTVDPDEFTTPANVYIGMLPNSSSAAFTGDIVGSILVGTRLEWIPCENPGGVIGYYEKHNRNFIAPTGSGTPVSLGYDASHLNVLSVVGTPEVLTIGSQTASVENLFEVNGVADEQDIISGVITRKVGVNVSAGVITLSALSAPVTEHTTPQPLSTVEGTNTVSWTAEVSGTVKEVEYAYQEPALANVPMIVNMRDWFWANGGGTLSAKCNSDSDAETFYLLVSGNEGDTTLTVDAGSPLAISDLYTKCVAAVIEYNDGSVDLCSVYVDSGSVTVYPPLKKTVTDGKLYSLYVGVHLTKAGYKYFTQSFASADMMYSQKAKAIAQYNPYDWANAGAVPFTKIGSFWWGQGNENIINDNYRVIEHGTVKYLNCSFVTGATAQSPKGFTWEVTLDGKNGYFEMYVGGRDTGQKTAEFAEGLEFNIEFYLDDVLRETTVKRFKGFEPIRFDFSNAQKGKVRFFVTGGAATYAAHIAQATWWETDVPHGKVFRAGKVPCLLMDSWGVYKDAEVETELERLLSVGVINKSQGSKTSAWGVENFDTLVLPENPVYMVTDFQINDINTSVSESDYCNNMETLISKSVNAGIIPVLLMQAHATGSGNYCAYTFPFVTFNTTLSTDGGDMP